MNSFRGFLILAGLVILGVLWGSFLWWYSSIPGSTRTSVKLFLWSVLVSLTFLIGVRVWDAYHDNRGKL